MRRPSREISIFNLSMLDVICSAMGAFLILFIFSQQQSSAAEKRADAERAALDECSQRLKACKTEPCAMRCPCDKTCPCAIHCPKPPANCAIECPCSKTCPCESSCPCDKYCEVPQPTPPFVTLVARWAPPGGKQVDIDLHILDPDGGHCSFTDRSGCGGELVKDYRDRGVTEVFVAHRIRADNRWWKVLYHYYSGEAPVMVEAALYHSLGKQALQTHRMARHADNKKVLVLEFRANEEGRLEFREH